MKRDYPEVAASLGLNDEDIGAIELLTLYHNHNIDPNLTNKTGETALFICSISLYSRL